MFFEKLKKKSFKKNFFVNKNFFEKKNLLGGGKFCQEKIVKMSISRAEYRMLSVHYGGWGW